MGIDNISGRKIKREVFESALDISQSRKKEILSVFDGIDAAEQDNQTGVLTEKAAISAFLNIIRVYTPEGLKDVLKSSGININDFEDLDETTMMVDLSDEYENRIGDISKLKNQIMTKNSISDLYPKAQDITEEFDIESFSRYDVKVFKTNTSVKYDESENDNVPEYDTFIIKFADTDHKEGQNIKLHIDKQLNSKKDIEDIIRQIAQNSSNIIDTLAVEIDDLYITSDNNNVQKHGGKNSDDGYGRMSKKFKAAAAYRRSDESINIYYNGKDFHDYLLHELGHAKDNASDTQLELYELIQKDNLKPSEYFLATPLEMYAEFFSDYADMHEDVLYKLSNDHESILSKIPEEKVEKFVEETAVTILTNQDSTISAVLCRAGLSEYKEFFEKILDKKSETVTGLKPYKNAKKMREYCKNNPKITELYIKLLHEIAYAYNDPKENVQKFKIE